MQFLSIKRETKLSDIGKAVGERNVEAVLHANNLPRTPSIGKAFEDQCQSIISSTKAVTPDKKITTLNQFTKDSDIFEAASLMSGSAWQVMSYAGTFLTALRIPESITIPTSSDTLGNNTPVQGNVYKSVIDSIKNPPHTVDPSAFNEYSPSRASNIIAQAGGMSTTNPMHWFVIPWGAVTLYSSLDGDSIQFPVYPEEMSDGVKANYTDMPELLYQYEPWKLYTSSGPRTNTYTFDFHRDMWTGDHRDGQANRLIRACMANCYPDYKGSAVYTSTVTLYVAGRALISGILTDVNVNWDGPIGLDGWYLHCKLELTITEVSPEPLNYTYMKNKPLIG